MDVSKLLLCYYVRRWGLRDTLGLGLHIDAGGGRGHVPCDSSIVALYVMIVGYDRRGYRHRHPASRTTQHVDRKE